jgi:hypothetical protein
MDVVGPAVQKHDHRAIGRAGFGVSDIQEAGIDLLERAEGRVRVRVAGLRRRGADHGNCMAARVMPAAPRKQPR